MALKLLCIGDIHLGRHPAGLPEAVLERVGAAELGPAAGWRLAVKEALRRRVDAALLAGDVVEQTDDFYEAYGDLARGVERLTGAGIPVLGVAGNHDVEVLPRLADAIPDFRLLGRGGTWETATLEDGAGSALRVLGWSFPEPVVRTSPLADRLPPREGGGVPRIGLLHCDRDQTGSRYAPVRTQELAAAPVDGWLLGHIHRPDPLEILSPPVGYLGSLVGLDPGEAGARGPWLLEAGAEGLRLTHLPLAPLRWEPLAVSLDGLEQPGDVHGAIVGEIRALHERIANGMYRPRAVGCRVRLTGRTGHRRAVRQALEKEADPGTLVWARDEILYFVEDWRLEAQPALDLETLAAGTDPPSLLARQVLVLRRGPDDPERRVLVEAARRRLEAAAGRSAFAPLQPEAPDPDATAALLEQAALRALDELLAQDGDAQ